MTRAASVRGPGIDEGKPVFSIYVARLGKGTGWDRVGNTQKALIFGGYHIDILYYTCNLNRFRCK